jgi:hypothetical protein
MPSPLDTVETYFRAKDGNRPFLMRRAFAPDIDLEVIVKTEAIAFPARSKGLAAIEDVVCRRFADDFENVHTFCLSRPTEADRHHFPCHWLVGMSAKGNGPIRVGSGRYDWYFTPDERCLAYRLVITIEEMRILPAATIDEVMGWLAGLPYPWCTPQEALGPMPAIQDLEPVRNYVSHSATPAPA